MAQPSETTAKRQVLILLFVVAGMVTLSYAAKPLYDTFCKVTGFGGTTRVATKAPDRIIDREIEIRFDANTPSSDLKFKPAQTKITIRPGETGLAFYTVENPLDIPITSVASYNVTPHKAGPFFQKIECFCFKETVFPPGPQANLPVVFYIDPQIEDQARTRDINVITLSYSFFDNAEAEKLAEKQRGTRQTAALQ